MALNRVLAGASAAKTAKLSRVWEDLPVRAPYTPRRRSRPLRLCPFQQERNGYAQNGISASCGALYRGYDHGSGGRRFDRFIEDWKSRHAVRRRGGIWSRRRVV